MTRMPASPAYGLGERKRDTVSWLLVAINKISGSPLLDKLHAREPAERAFFEVTSSGFKVIAAASRQFKAVRELSRPARVPAARPGSLFDLTPTDDQRMIVAAVREFAEEQLRPDAQEADTTCTAPKELLAAASELGLGQISVPEEMGGLASERSTVTNILVAEALSHGDMGLAVACLAPAAVTTALSLWGDGAQQATYLPAFEGAEPPPAALALLEPRPLFDPLHLRTTATVNPEGYLLNGVKSMVPLAADAELFVVAAELPGSGPSLFIIESSTKGLAIEAGPAMGLRAASIGTLLLEHVQVPKSALLGAGDPAVYTECVRLSRLGWAALSLGTAQAVLDYVIPYVKDRSAFGQVIGQRQAVAFTVADIAIELEGMRLATYRAASRAEQGRSYTREVALARTLTSSKGMAIGSAGVQLLGGHGYVKEHPVERWYRDLRAVGLMEGVLLV